MKNWITDESKDDCDNMLYADNGVITESEFERYDRYNRNPAPIKDSLAYPDEEPQKEAGIRERLKEKWSAFREWIGNWDAIITVQLIQGVAIAFLAIANLLTLSLALAL